MDENLEECREIAPYLSDHAEGLLQGQVLEMVNGHLASCRDCRNEFAVVKGFVEKLRSIDEYEAPAQLAAGVAARLRQDEAMSHELERASFTERMFRMFARPVIAVGAAAVAVVCIVSFVVFSAPGGRPVSTVAFRADDGITVSGGKIEIDGVLVDASEGTLEVEPGQRLSVPRAGKVLLSYGEGSRVLASRRASFRLTDDGVNLDRGYLELSMSKTGIRFIVRTPQADVIVRGTEYTVEVGSATRVQVKSGSVAVESRLTKESVLLGAGDKASVMADGHIRSSLTNPAPPATVPVDPAGGARQSEDTRLFDGDEN